MRSWLIGFEGQLVCQLEILSGGMVLFSTQFCRESLTASKILRPRPGPVRKENSQRMSMSEQVFPVLENAGKFPVSCFQRNNLPNSLLLLFLAFFPVFELRSQASKAIIIFWIRYAYCLQYWSLICRRVLASTFILCVTKSKKREQRSRWSDGKDNKSRSNVPYISSGTIEHQMSLLWVNDTDRS